MSGIPLWAYPAVFILCTLFLLTGMWYGFDRGIARADEEVTWAREQERARHPAGRGRHETPGRLALSEVPPEVAHEAWLAHAEQAMAIANEHPAEIDVTGWTQRMAADMDAWIKANIPGAG